MRTSGIMLLGEPISGKPQYVKGYTFAFEMPIGFSKAINLNQKEHQVEAT